MEKTTRHLTTEEKALKINLQSDIYGCFAEIGAGQEVAANFFKAGGSSGTIAFTHSAYDMKVSDSMYGKAKRYVCEERLQTMLDTEFNNLKTTLPNKYKESRFFAFCNTVESLNYHKTNQGKGWIGMVECIFCILQETNAKHKAKICWKEIGHDCTIKRAAVQLNSEAVDMRFRAAGNVFGRK